MADPSVFHADMDSFSGPLFDLNSGLRRNP
jgi:hypothetical protein